MFTLIQPFLELALFKRTPQELPESSLLMWLALASHAVLGVLHFLQRFSVIEALLAGICSTALLVVLTLSLLVANGLVRRLVRTLTALAGIDVVIGVLSLPVSTLLHHTAGNELSVSLASVVFIVLLAWNLGAAGHVLRHALSAPLLMGMVVALIYFVVSLTVMNQLFPGLD